MSRSAPLTRERIVTAAVGMADEQGFDAVSMRRVAVHLDAGAMSLYRHVADKGELVSAMVDRVTGEYSCAGTDPSGLDWRERIHLLARSDWRMFMEHPWMLTATTTLAPPFGTESLASMEWALEALSPLGLQPHEAARVIMTVTTYVQGSVRIVLGGPEHSGDDGGTKGGDDPGLRWQARLRDRDMDRFPRLQELVRGYRPEPDRDWFADGIDMILDGVPQPQR